MKYNYNTTPKKLELACLEKLPPSTISSLNDKLKYYDIKDTKLIIRQDTSDLKNDIINELGRTDVEINEKDAIIMGLKKELQSSKLNNNEILNECKALFPSIKNLSIAKHYYNEGTDSVKVVGVMVYDCASTLDSTTSVKLKDWLKIKLKMEEIALFKRE